MKVKFTVDIFIFLLIIGFGGYIAINTYNRFVSKSHLTYNKWQNRLTPIDEYIPDTLPHKEYKKTRDSLTATSALKNGDAMLSRGLKFFNVGIVTGISCDTCSIQWLNQRSFKDTAHVQHYIKLDAWTINQRNELAYMDEGRFYVKNKQGYLRKTVIVFTAKRKDGSVYNKIDIADVPVKFRFDHNSKAVLIPVNKSVAGAFSKTLVGMVIMTVLCAIFLIMVFLRLIINLSKGISFTQTNIICLKILAVGLMLYPIMVVLPGYLIKWIYADYFTPDIILNDKINNNSGFVFIAGILFLFLSNAFRKGKMLKEEQDLTV